MELWPAYDSVFHDHHSYESWCASVWDQHRTRDGFRLARAYDSERLVGFAYGYMGEAGE